MPRRLPIALGAAIALAAPGSPALAQEQAQKPRTIDVIGDASLTARNDAARFVFGVEVRRRTARAALGTASRRMRRVIAAVRAAGVEERDIQTRDVRVRRSVRRRRGRRPSVSYVAANSIRVILRDVRRAGTVLDVAVRAGATSARGPSFFILDSRALYRRALVSAFDDARAKAEDLARQAGVTLGRVLSIREGGREEPVAPEGQQRAPAVPAPAPTQPGETRIEATVGVVFEVQ